MLYCTIICYIIYDMIYIYYDTTISSFKLFPNPPAAAALCSTMCVLMVNRGKVGHSNAVYEDIPYVWFVQKISGLEL
jgi:hypothetical protein